MMCVRDFPKSLETLTSALNNNTIYSCVNFASEDKLHNMACYKSVSARSQML